MWPKGAATGSSREASKKPSLRLDARLLKHPLGRVLEAVLDIPC